MKNNLKNNVLIDGTITAIAWDEDGISNEFSLYTNDEEDFILKGNKYLKKIKKFENKSVRIKGIINIDENGEKELVIKNIRLSKHKNERKKITKYYDEFKLLIPQFEMVY